MAVTLAVDGLAVAVLEGRGVALDLSAVSVDEYYWLIWIGFIYFDQWLLHR